MPCTFQFWVQWARFVEHHPSKIGVYCPNCDSAYRNAAIRLGRRGVPKVCAWNEVLRGVVREDVPKFEDAFSRALKTGRDQKVTYRFRPVDEPHRVVTWVCALKAVPCDLKQCCQQPLHCSVVVAEFVPKTPQDAIF
jgi:hypothetical protein